MADRRGLKKRKRKGVKKMTEKEKEIIEMLNKLFLVKGEAVGPTEFGLALGMDYSNASSYCTSALKKALKVELIERTGRGKYSPVLK